MTRPTIHPPGEVEDFGNWAFSKSNIQTKSSWNSCPLPPPWAAAAARRPPPVHALLPKAAAPSPLPTAILSRGAPRRSTAFPPRLPAAPCRRPLSASRRAAPSSASPCAAVCVLNNVRCLPSAARRPATSSCSAHHWDWRSTSRASARDGNEDPTRATPAGPTTSSRPARAAGLGRDVLSRRESALVSSAENPSRRPTAIRREYMPGRRPLSASRRAAPRRARSPGGHTPRCTSPSSP